MCNICTTLDNSSVSTPIFVGNNTGNSVDILSPFSFLLAGDPYADAYEMHGHADITYVMSRVGTGRSPRNKACDAPICALVFRRPSAGGINPFITSHYLPATRMNVRVPDRHRKYFKGSTHIHHLASRTKVYGYHFLERSAAQTRTRV